jgi:hypothetical protein
MSEQPKPLGQPYTLIGGPWHGSIIMAEVANELLGAEPAAPDEIMQRLVNTKSRVICNDAPYAIRVCSFGDDKQQYFYLGYEHTPKEETDKQMLEMMADPNKGGGVFHSAPIPKE